MPDPSIRNRRGSLVPMVDTDDLFVQLVEALDRDLELLGVLRYRLIVLGALAGADQGPSLPTAVREIEVAYEDLRLADLVRATATVAVAEEFDLDPMPRLDQLAARSRRGVERSPDGATAFASSRPSSGSRAWRPPSGRRWGAGPRWPKRRWPFSGSTPEPPMGARSCAVGSWWRDRYERHGAVHRGQRARRRHRRARHGLQQPVEHRHAGLRGRAGRPLPRGRRRPARRGSRGHRRVGERADRRRVRGGQHRGRRGTRRGDPDEPGDELGRVDLPRAELDRHRLAAVDAVVRPLDPRLQRQSGRRRAGGGRCGPVGGHVHQRQFHPVEPAGLVAAERGGLGRRRRGNAGPGEQPPDGGRTAQCRASWPGRPGVRTSTRCPTRAVRPSTSWRLSSGSVPPPRPAARSRSTSTACNWWRATWRRISRPPDRPPRPTWPSSRRTG